MMKRLADEIGERVRIAREIILPGGSQEQVAAKLDVDNSAWSRWERGEATIPYDIANLIHGSYPIERDWLIWGGDRFLSPTHREAIERAKAAIEAAPKRGRKPKSA